MFVRLFHSFKIILRDLLIWLVFSFAIVRGLELFIFNYFIINLLLPGCIFFLFLFYKLLKTNRFLNYWNFILSIIFISVIYHSLSYAILKFIRLHYLYEGFLQFVIMFLVSLFISSILYFLSYFIKRILKI